MKSIREYLILLLALLICLDVSAAQIACRPYNITGEKLSSQQEFGEGLLWEISRDSHINGYVFGTIHVDDAEILDLVSVIHDSLQNSSQFAMEVIPASDDAEKFSESMFFADGRRLDQLLPPHLYQQTLGILQEYKLGEEVVALLKPWAAFVLMSYPQDMGTVLDVKLLAQAQQESLTVSGLETIEEQITVFADLDIEAQLRILADTVCHYDNTDEDFEVMKSLYLARDLQGLVDYSRRYQFEDNTVYERAYERLIDRRNFRMVERILELLTRGTSFVAVGAMHLPGENGILNLLKRHNYTIKRLY